MRYIIWTGVMLLPSIICAEATSHKIEITDPKGSSFYVQLHRDDYSYRISNSKEDTDREAVAVLTHNSEMLPDDIQKAWYDYESTVIYLTTDHRLSAIYPVYHRCGHMRLTWDMPEKHQYVGIAPNPVYQLQFDPILSIGQTGPHCFIYTDGKPYQAADVSATAATSPFI